MDPVTEKTVDRIWTLVWKAKGMPEWSWSTWDEDAMVRRIDAIHSEGVIEWYRVYKKTTWTQVTEEDVTWMNKIYK